MIVYNKLFFVPFRGIFEPILKKECIRLPDKKKKYKNLSTYVVCMILTIVIVIIFAAMADNREELYETQLNEKEQLNINIQNQIVSLTEENYSLKQEVEKQTQIISQQNEEVKFFTTMNEAWMLIAQNKQSEAKAKAEELKDFPMTKERETVYQTLINALQ